MPRTARNSEDFIVTGDTNTGIVSQNAQSKETSDTSVSTDDDDGKELILLIGIIVASTLIAIVLFLIFYLLCKRTTLIDDGKIMAEIEE